MTPLAGPDGSTSSKALTPRSPASFFTVTHRPGSLLKGGKRRARPPLRGSTDGTGHRERVDVLGRLHREERQHDQSSLRLRCGCDQPPPPATVIHDTDVPLVVDDQPAHCAVARRRVVPGSTARLPPPSGAAPLGGRAPFGRARVRRALTVSGGGVAFHDRTTCGRIAAIRLPAAQLADAVAQEICQPRAARSRARVRSV